MIRYQYPLHRNHYFLHWNQHFLRRNPYFLHLNQYFLCLKAQAVLLSEKRCLPYPKYRCLLPSAACAESKGQCKYRQINSFFHQIFPRILFFKTFFADFDTFFKIFETSSFCILTHSSDFLYVSHLFSTASPQNNPAKIPEMHSTQIPAVSQPPVLP